MKVKSLLKWRGGGGGRAGIDVSNIGKQSSFRKGVHNYTFKFRH